MRGINKELSIAKEYQKCFSFSTDLIHINKINKMFILFSTSDNRGAHLKLLPYQYMKKRWKVSSIAGNHTAQLTV